MKTELERNLDGEVIGYYLTMSEKETWRWANWKPYWPCSKIANHSLTVEVDKNGLVVLKIDGHFNPNKEIPGEELDAIIEDYMPKQAEHLWPAWNSQGGRL